MMNEVLFADLCDNLKKMNEAQLKALAEMAEERIVERRDRFEQLCAGFYDYLRSLQEEFLNAKVYLCQKGEPDFDVMDLIIPEKMWEVCEIGD